MALCEGQLDTVLHINGEDSQTDKKMEANGDIYGLDNVPPHPLSVDYRSPVSHFVPPGVELYANRHKPEIHVEALEKKAKREYRRRTTGAKTLKPNTGTRVKTMPSNKISMRKMASKMASKMAVRKVDKKIVIRRKSKFLKRKGNFRCA